MKVLYVTNDFSDEVGGISAHLEELSRRVAERAEVVVAYLSLRGRQGSFADDWGRQQYIVPHVGSWRRRVLRFPRRWLRSLIAEQQPAVVHVHSPIEAGCLPCDEGPAKVYTNHSSALYQLMRFPSLSRPGIQRVLKKFHTVICPQSSERPPNASSRRARNTQRS